MKGTSDSKKLRTSPRRIVSDEFSLRLSHPSGDEAFGLLGDEFPQQN